MKGKKMSRKKMYTVYDCKSEIYVAPMLHSARGEALRAFETECNNEGSMLNAHPADFTFFEIGEFDPLTGEVMPYDAKVNLGTGLDFIKKIEVKKPKIV